jgi:hypothetical protein
VQPALSVPSFLSLLIGVRAGKTQDRENTKDHEEREEKQAALRAFAPSQSNALRLPGLELKRAEFTLELAIYGLLVRDLGDRLFYIHLQGIRRAGCNRRAGGFSPEEATRGIEPVVAIASGPYHIAQRQLA